MTTALPVLEVDGYARPLMDFSEGGFRADLPGTYQRVGSTGTGTIRITAAGHCVQKRIAFEVVNSYEESVGARFQTLEVITEASDTLF